MTSRAQQLFARIAADGFDYVRSLVNAKAVETQYLEFKGGRIQKDPKGLKEAWSEALSGFANTEGGVLIFGVRASKVPDPDNPSVSIDAAHAFDPVDSPAALRQWLRDRFLEATVPPISGVDCLALDDPAESGKGVVVCFVPEGRDKPYRAELHPKKNYMQRVDDRFVVIQHSLLRTLFYPQLHPRLFVEIEPKVEHDDDGGEVTFKGSVGNSGTATASELWIVVRPNSPLTHKVMFSFKPRADVIPDGQAWEAFQSIHPGATVPVFWYELRLKAQDRIPPATFSIQLFSQHQFAQVVTVHLSTDDIISGRKVSKHAELRET